MKNLQNFGVQELNTLEVVSVTGGNGGGWFWGGLAYDFLKWAVCENNEEYGRRMLASGSLGGHK